MPLKCLRAQTTHMHKQVHVCWHNLTAHLNIIRFFSHTNTLFNNMWLLARFGSLQLWIIPKMKFKLKALTAQNSCYPGKNSNPNHSAALENVKECIDFELLTVIKFIWQLFLLIKTPILHCYPFHPYIHTSIKSKDILCELGKLYILNV